MPLISVIIPVYNVEKYLEKCICSVISQSYKDLEIILVNDGSTDNSAQICEEYKKKDSRIKVIHKLNSGVADTRNQGLKVATGEYIAFLDSDDWIHEELYNTLYSLITKYDADISMCNFKRVLSENEQLDITGNENVYGNIEILNKLYTEERTLMVIPWNKLYKKEILIGMEFPKGKIHEDVFLIPKILYNANKIVYTEKELVCYRYTPNSITTSSFYTKRLDYLEAIENISDFFREKNLHELYVKNIIHEIKSILAFSIDIQVFEENIRLNIINKFLNKINEKEKIVSNHIDFKTRMKINIFKFKPKLYIFIYDYINKIKRIKRKVI